MPITNGSPRARALAAALRKARVDRGISNRELAARLKCDQSYLSRIETGQRTPGVELTARILGALQTPPEVCEQILALARNAAEPNWLTVGMPGIPLQLAGAVESERAASALYDWSPMIMPGLLQTPDYVRAMAEADGFATHEVESRVMVRTSRREILTRREPVRYDVLLGEMALRQPIGSPEVMVEQLEYLMKMAQKHANISLRVVPIRVGWHPGTAGPFVLYELPDAPPFVHFEHYSSGAFVTDSDDMKAYRRALDMIEQKALAPNDSAEFIARVIEEEYLNHD